METEGTIFQLGLKFFKNASKYGIGVILVRLGSFFVLPIFWKHMDPEQFGIIGLSNALLTFLGPVFGLGLSDAVQRFYFDWKPERRRAMVATIFFGSVLFGSILALLLDSVGPTLFPVLIEKVPFNPVLRVTLWAGFFSAMNLIPLAVLRMEEKTRSFSALTVAMFLTQTGFTLFFVVFRKTGALGYITGQWMHFLFWGLVFLGLMFRDLIRGGLQVDGKEIGKVLHFALPTVPTAVLEGAFSTLDRFFLDKFGSLSTVGVYTVAGQFGSALNVCNQILRLSWFPMLFRSAAERKDTPRVLGRLAPIYVALLLIVAHLIAVFSAPVIEWIGNPKYLDVHDYIPFLLFAYWVQSIGTAYGRGMDLANRMKLSFWVPLISGVVGWIAMAYAVPKWGGWGVALAFIVAIATRTTVQVALSYWVYPRPTDFRAILALTIGVVGGLFIAPATQTLVLSLPVGLAFTLGTFWVCTGMNRHPLVLIKKTLGR